MFLCPFLDVFCSLPTNDLLFQDFSFKATGNLSCIYATMFQKKESTNIYIENVSTKIPVTAWYQRIS